MNSILWLQQLPWLLALLPLLAILYLYSTASTPENDSGIYVKDPHSGLGYEIVNETVCDVPSYYILFRQVDRIYERVESDLSI